MEVGWCTGWGPQGQRNDTVAENLMTVNPTENCQLFPN